MIHSILLIGQSNMGGRGKPEEVEPIRNPQLKVMRNGRWQGMYVPVNPDRSFSGINLSESFADAYSKNHPDVEVGLIPCADGGTMMEQWMPGTLLYDHAVYMSRLALRTSTIVGVLWHQGESDCRPPRYEQYEKRLALMLESLRKDLDLHDVPFIVGGLGDFLKDREETPFLVNYPIINQQLKHYAATHPLTGFASAEGLQDNRDKLHFDAKSLREFGLRYYAEFEKLENKEKVFEDKPLMDAAIRTEFDAL
ncbi:MAG: sialate O-acetylesterase [Clostridiales bacterium]|nr:sialate O-acetylesterase [Clostridiales bacterium]